MNGTIRRLTLLMTRSSMQAPLAALIAERPSAPQILPHDAIKVKGRSRKRRAFGSSCEPLHRLSAERSSTAESRIRYRSDTDRASPEKFSGFPPGLAFLPRVGDSLH
jgi:hypothetical protein